MSHPVITIEERPISREGRAQQWLRGRRVMFAGILAAAEVLGYVVARPNRWLAMLAVVALLAGCYSLAKRVPAGLGRDLLWIVAFAQIGLIAVPILVGVVQVMVAALVAIALIVLIVAVALRFRR